MKRLSIQPHLVEQVYETLLDAICAGKLAPGERLAQEHLAERLNVSRQPVSHALLLLKKQGFVTDVGRRGLQVAPLDAAQVAAIYQVRGALDGVAAALAARRATCVSAGHGQALVVAGRKAIESGDITRTITADIEFHRFLYDLSGNPLIADTADLHWHHIRRVMGSVLREGSLEEIWHEHADILSAVLAGDAERAERLARRHTDNASRSFAAHLATVPDRVAS